MNILKKECRLCLSCMESHDILTVEVEEKNIFKGEEVIYIATYDYCENTDDYYASEEQITKNDIAMKNAYREKVGLLTSKQINEIRCKYGISQTDLSNLLGWGAKTITRYEGHQVQDVVHDSVLRKLDDDPAWYLEFLASFKYKLSETSYQKYYDTARQIYETKQNEYLFKVIKAIYARYENLTECTGGKILDLDKVIDVVRYFANSTKVKFLHKVKLMKMLWYSDALSYKKTGVSMTGLVYESLPMGAVPVAYKHIIDLKGINYIEEEFDEGTKCIFLGDDNHNYANLSDKDINILDCIIAHFGDATKTDIVNAMHNEVAYIETAPKDIIQYKYAKELSI